MNYLFRIIFYRLNRSGTDSLYRLLILELLTTRACVWMKR